MITRDILQPIKNHVVKVEYLPIQPVSNVIEKENKVEMWYCEKFENPNKEGRGRGQNIMKGLKGVPFEYSSSMGTMKIKMVAKEVSIDPVADSKFVLSTEGYKMMTMDEIKAMQGGK